MRRLASSHVPYVAPLATSASLIKRMAFSSTQIQYNPNNNNTPNQQQPGNSNNTTTADTKKLPEGGDQQQPPLGLGAAIQQFLLETFWYSSHNASTATGDFKSKLVNYADFVTGNDKTPEELEREKKKREAYNDIRGKQYAAEKAKEAEKTKDMSTLEWLKYKAQTLKETAKETTSKKQGMVSLVQHCTAAHAAEVAVEQGIDVKSVNIVLEDMKTQNSESESAATGRGSSVGEGQTMVGYIDAPGASDEEVMQYAERLTKACPAANTMQNHMEWRRAPTTAPSSSDTDDLRGRYGGGGAQSSPSSYEARGSGFSAFSNKKKGGSSSSGGSFDNPFAGLNIPKAKPTTTSSSPDNNKSTGGDSSTPKPPQE